jgi:tetratricopeptide (TPR) repeat protein
MTKQYEQAIHSYRLAIKLNTKSPESHFNLASALNDHGQHDYALRHYKVALDLDPENLDALLNIAQIHEKMEAWREAYHYYVKATKIASTNQVAEDGRMAMEQKL